MTGEGPGGDPVEAHHLARARATSQRNLALFWTCLAAMYLTWGVMGEGALAWSLFTVLAVVAVVSWARFGVRRREEEEAGERLRTDGGR